MVFSSGSDTHVCHSRLRAITSDAAVSRDVLGFAQIPASGPSGQRLRGELLGGAAGGFAGCGGSAALPPTAARRRFVHMAAGPGHPVSHISFPMSGTRCPIMLPVCICLLCSQLGTIFCPFLGASLQASRDRNPGKALPDHGACDPGIWVTLGSPEAAMRLATSQEGGRVLSSAVSRRRSRGRLHAQQTRHAPPPAADILVLMASSSHPVLSQTVPVPSELWHRRHCHPHSRSLAPL